MTQEVTAVERVADIVSRAREDSGLDDRQISLVLGIHPRALELWDGEVSSLSPGLSGRLTAFTRMAYLASQSIPRDAVAGWWIMPNTRLGGLRPLELVVRNPGLLYTELAGVGQGLG